MRANRFSSGLIVFFIVAGCSVHPIPDDISRETTFSIVNNIRCEVKNQVRARMQALLDDPSNHPEVRQIPAEDVLHYVQTLVKYAPHIATKVSKYAAIIIGYSFDFNITESNLNSGILDFELPFTNTNFQLTANGKANFTRHAQRTFALADSFSDLSLLDCTGASRPGRNIAYPITGSIGAATIIDTYLDLGKSGGNSDGKAGPFTDVITFTTEIGGDINPTITINAVPNNFRLTKASGTFSSDRTDVHAVTIIIAFPTIDDRVFQPGILTRQQLEAARAESNKIVAEELCILKAREEELGAVVLRQQPPEVYCKDARLR